MGSGLAPLLLLALIGVLGQVQAAPVKDKTSLDKTRIHIPVPAKEKYWASRGYVRGWRFSRVEEVARTVEFETENEVEEEVAFDKVDIEEEDDPLISTVRQTTAETTSTTERTSTSTTAAATTTMTTTITATTPRTPASTSTAPEVARRELMNVDMNIISVKFEGPFDPEELYRILNQTTVTFQLFSSVAGAPQLSRRFPEFIFVPGKRPGEGAVENSFVQMVNGGVRMSYHVALQFKASPGRVGEGRGQPPGTRIRTGDGQDYKVLARM